MAQWQLPYYGQHWVLVRITGFVVGISTLTHLATTLFRLSSWQKWVFATIVPTVGLVAWYVMGVQFWNEHPGSIGVYGFTAGGLFWFPVGFAIVDMVMAGVDRLGPPESKTDSAG